MRNKIAFITGATSGIGKDTAEVFAENGIDLILCGRRIERLEKMKDQLQKMVDITLLSFDVRRKVEVQSKISGLPDEWKKIDILVNNAGNAHGFDPIQSGDIDDWDAMIDINVKGLLYVSKSVIPGMVDRRSGHVVNIGSIAGKEVYPGGNVYCASKYAVDAINNGMRLDLNEYGIKVSQINPGLVNTEFSNVRFKGDDERSVGVYKGMEPLTGRDIAEIIYFVVSRPKHVNIADTIILPTAQANTTMVKRSL